jgi:hypothetical protein
MESKSGTALKEHTVSVGKTIPISKALAAWHFYDTG